MQLHPTYKANEEIKKFITPSDKYFAFEPVDKLFDRHWAIETMKRVCPNELRSMFVPGKDIGNTKQPNVKFFLQIGY